MLKYYKVKEMTTVSVDINSNTYRMLQEFNISIQEVLDELVESKSLQLLSLRKAEREGWDNAEELFNL
jgi:hypothetical protein